MAINTIITTNAILHQSFVLLQSRINRFCQSHISSQRQIKRNNKSNKVLLSPKLFVFQQVYPRELIRLSRRQQQQLL